MGKYADNMELPGLSVTTIVLDLAGDPNYVAPAVVEEPVNPFLKQGGNIKEIHLMGYASPEGPYPLNEALAP